MRRNLSRESYRVEPDQGFNTEKPAGVIPPPPPSIPNSAKNLLELFKSQPNTHDDPFWKNRDNMKNQNNGVRTSRVEEFEQQSTPQKKRSPTRNKVAITDLPPAGLSSLERLRNQ